MSDLKTWLEQLGLSKYFSAFSENEVAFSDLPDLTEDDLKEIGLPVGPRRDSTSPKRTVPGVDARPSPQSGLHPSTAPTARIDLPYYTAAATVIVDNLRSDGYPLTASWGRWARSQQHSLSMPGVRTKQGGFQMLTSASRKNAARQTLAASAVLALSFGITQAAAADCTRHIYNQSADVWDVFGPSFQGQLQPGYTYVIEWDSSMLDAVMQNRASVRLYAWGGTPYDATFSVRSQYDGDCVYIEHSGNTGRAVLNTPANGDISLID